MERLTDLNLLRTFVAVAECRSITRAASELRLPKSTVSRQIAKLEESRDVELFLRNRTGLDLTPLGRRLFEHVRHPILALTERKVDVLPDGVAGSIRLYAPAVYFRGVLQPAIFGFAGQYPNISLEMILGDRFTEPEPDEVDLAIYVGQSPGKAFEIWSFAPVEARLYASPLLFETTPAPSQPSELENWPILTSNCSPGANSRLNLYRKGERAVAPTGRARLVTAAPDLLAGAAVEGLGIARLPTFVAEPHLRQGTLVPVLSDCVLERHAVTLSKWHRNTNESARLLAQYLVTQIGQ